MIRETEERLLPGAACAVLFVHGILGSPAQFAPFLPLVRQLVVPCRAYFSERDELVPVRSAREFVGVPQAVVTMLPHSGHAYYEAHEDLPLLQRDFRAMLQECEKKR